MATIGYKLEDFLQRVYQVVQKIPRGRVMTYGQVAAALGNPRAARAVGRALHHNPMPGIVPCHRVVNARGGLAESFAFGGAAGQRRYLQAEGVAVSPADTVELKYFGYECEGSPDETID